MIMTIMMMMMLMIVGVVTATTTKPEAAYGQVPTVQDEAERLLNQPPATPGGGLPPQQQPSDIKIIDGDDIQNNILTDITLSELQNYRLHEDGKAEYIFESTNPGSNRTITVLTNHGYTSAQGYIYNSTGIYTPDGSQRLVIATE